MTVAQSGLVDWLGIEKQSGDISLTIVDDSDWSDEQNHLLLLQEKLNTYLAFIESGEVFVRLVEEAGRSFPRTTPVKVTILARFDLSERAQAFMLHATKAFSGAGFVLAHRVVRATPTKNPI